MTSQNIRNGTQALNFLNFNLRNKYVTTTVLKPIFYRDFHIHYSRSPKRIMKANVFMIISIIFLAKGKSRMIP